MVLEKTLESPLDLILLQTLYLDFAARLTAVVPYMCYARSDKKDQPRVPITARLVADMIEVAGTNRYIQISLRPSKFSLENGNNICGGL